MKQLLWHEAIEQVLCDNGGVASLEVPYRDIARYRDLTTNQEWKATLRGILYREMQRKGQIVRVGLGVFALHNALRKRTLFQRLAESEAVRPQRLSHAEVEGMLLELGNFYGYDTYTADAQKVFDDKPLASIATLKDLPPFTFPDLLSQARQIDVLWFERKPRPFSKFAFKCGDDPEFRRALLRLYQLRDFDTALYVVPTKPSDLFLRSAFKTNPFMPCAIASFSALLKKCFASINCKFNCQKSNPASLPSICVPDGDASEGRRYSLRKTLNMPQNK